MRNIKTTLRSTRNSGLLFVAASGLLYLTACSSDVLYDAPNPNIVESNVTIGNDPAAQAHRITFFGNTNPGTRIGFGTRAATDFDMPTCPEESVYKNLAKTSDVEYAWQIDNESYYKGQDMLIPAGTTYGQFATSAKYYVAGTLNWSNGFMGVTGRPEIYVLPGGTFKMGGTLPTEITVYNYGTIETPYGLTVAGKLYSNNDIDADGEVHINTSGEFLCKGSLVADKIELEGNASACSFIATNFIKFDGNGTFKASYFKANEVELRAGIVILDQDGLLNANKILCTNEETKFYVEDNGTNAIVVADIFDINNIKWASNIFAKEIACDFKTITVAGKKTFWTDGYQDGNNWIQPEEREYKMSDLNITGYDPNRPIYVPIGPCHSEYGTNPNPGGNPTENPEEPTFTPIAIITPPDQGPTHTHNHLSATCVKDVNGRAYVSYHLNAEYEDNEEWADISEHMGCVEIYDVDENQAQITSWLMNQDFDFNHLLVDDNKVYTVGDTKKFGATLGLINLDNNGNFGQYEMNTEGREGIMTYYKLYGDKEQKGSSGNCIILDNNTFRIASYNGFQSFGVNDLTKQTDFISTSGSAKHVAKGGNYIVTLNLDQKKVEASTATVTVYSTWGTPITTFKTHEIITPIDGKNVIATDGSYIYVALGEKGVGKYDMSGTLVGKYCWITEQQLGDDEKKPLANGLCVDENYIYVANGAAGMIVLDNKNHDDGQLKRVARYVRPTQIEENGEMRNFSANYVQKVTRNGVDYLYIAYGRNGLEVVKMTAPAK